MTKAAVSCNTRQRGRVVDRGLNAAGVQMRRQRIAPRMQNRIEVTDVGALRRARQDPAKVYDAGLNQSDEDVVVHSVALCKPTVVGNDATPRRPVPIPALDQST